METQSEEISTASVVSSHDGELAPDNHVPEIIDHYDAEPKPEISEEEIKRILEMTASSGKFWHDWEKLRGMLSFYLKQVLSEYAEAKMTEEQQNASLGETFLELVRRLDEALLGFDEGPPFTLQRLCEILLGAHSIYPKLSKLALALEKNLLVTSTVAVSIEPYPQTTEQQIPQVTTKADEETRETDTSSDSVPNGVESIGTDKDEIMTEVDEAEVDDAMTIDTEAVVEAVAAAEKTEPENEPEKTESEKTESEPSRSS